MDNFKVESFYQNEYPTYVQNVRVCTGCSLEQSETIANRHFNIDC